MGGAKAASPEHEVLRARTRGEVSADAAFERLHALYAPSVRAWLLLRVRGTEAEDLVQDVWTIFYHRWRRWEQRPGMDVPEARPVLRPEDLDVLLAKLAGVPAREIAGTLGVTESVVDHRFRNALTRVRTRLEKRGGRHA